MSRFLDTIGLSSLSVAICDRCKKKYPYANQIPDGNIPAIKVCSDSCSDMRDPYRLPARQPEKISIRFPRPDADIAERHQSITTDPNTDVDNNGSGEFGIALEQGNNPNNGNLNNLSQ